MRHRANFRSDRSNRCRNMAIFRFFKVAAAAILHFLNFKFLTVERVKKAKVRQCAKFRGDWSDHC